MNGFRMTLLSIAVAMAGRASAGYEVTGTVVDGQGDPLDQASICLQAASACTTSGPDGAFLLSSASSSIRGATSPRSGGVWSAIPSDDDIRLISGQPGPWEVSLHDATGAMLLHRSVHPAGGEARIAPSAGSALAYLVVRSGRGASVVPIAWIGREVRRGSGYPAGRAAAFRDTLRIKRMGYVDTSIALGGDTLALGVIRMRESDSFPGASDSGYITDSRDGCRYRWIRIGSQTWMGQNLGYDTAAGVGSWCTNSTSASPCCEGTGRHYNWLTAMGRSTAAGYVVGRYRGVCPEGWHVPTRGEWDSLAATAGDRANGFNGKHTAGQRLKAKAFHGTDDFGFGITGAGRWSSGSFENQNQYAYYLTADYIASLNQFQTRFFYWDAPSVGMGTSHRSDGVSLRCVKD